LEGEGGEQAADWGRDWQPRPCHGDVREMCKFAKIVDDRNLVHDADARQKTFKREMRFPKSTWSEFELPKLGPDSCNLNPNNLYAKTA